jgi:hypothetical protein
MHQYRSALHAESLLSSTLPYASKSRGKPAAESQKVPLQFSPAKKSYWRIDCADWRKGWSIGESLKVAQTRTGYLTRNKQRFRRRESGGPTGIRTQNQGIMLTTSAFAAGRKPCVVWTMPSPCRAIATKVGDYGLYTLPGCPGLGSALGRRARARQAVHRIYT